MIKIIFFDFDGVLTPDKDDIISTCRYISGQLSLDLEETCELYKDDGTDLKKLYSGKIKADQFWEGFYQKLSSAGKISMEYDEFAPMMEKSFIDTPIDRKMLDLARRIKDTGEYQLGIITDNSIERVKALAEKYDLYDIFDVIVISAEQSVRAVKTDGNKIFKTAEERTNTQPENCVFIENKEHNLDIPSKRGYKTIHFDDEKRDYVQFEADLKAAGVQI